jgi:tetratricopeptide (TPR) repeat protein
MDALYAAHDEERLAPVREDLEAGHAAHAAGRLDEMRQRFDEVLLRAPDLPQRADLAQGYADLGADALAADRLEEAVRWYRRATRLAPQGAQRGTWEAQLRFAEAELSLTAGVADVDAYERALALDPDHEGAAEALAVLTGDRPPELESKERRWAAAAGVLLLAIAGWFLFINRRREDPVLEASAAEAIDDIDGEPDTLPG